MSISFAWSESNGAGQVVTDGITNLNFGSSDTPNVVPTSARIASGTHSYTKYIRGKFTGSGTVSNLLFWLSAGSLITGETIKAAANVTYATPTRTATVDSNVPVLISSALSINSYEGVSTIAVGTSGVSGYTKYIRLQLQTTISIAVGAVNVKTFTLQYDAI